MFAQRSRGLLTLGGGLFAQCRAYSSSAAGDAAPTTDEVRKAYSVLGANLNSDFKEIRRRYLQLAKEHHPDVSASEGRDSHKSMSTINEAYSLVERHFKGGGRVPAGGTPSRGQQHQAPSDDPSEDPFLRFYGGGFTADMFTQQHLRREAPMQWEEFFAFQGRGRPDPLDDNEFEAMRAFYDAQTPNFRNHRAREPRSPKGGPRSNEARGADPAAKDERRSEHPGAEARAWTDGERDALANMYQEGRSFDFISNALGRAVSDVLDQYNHMSHAAFQHRRRPANETRFREGPEPEFATDAHGEPITFDNFYGDPESEYFMMDEHGNIVDVEGDGMPNEDDEPIPYGRGTTMFGFRNRGPSHSGPFYSELSEEEEAEASRSAQRAKRQYRDDYRGNGRGNGRGGRGRGAAFSGAPRGGRGRGRGNGGGRGNRPRFY